MNNIVIKNISDITTRNIDSSFSRSEKERLVQRAINPAKYSVVGFVDRTNQAVLEARFHNVRDRKGRFARVRQRA